MMDVQLVPKTVLPSGPQASPQAPPANGADANASSRTILVGAAQAVTVSAEVGSPSVERRQDRLGRQEDEVVTAQQALDSLRLTSRRTQLEFDQELDIVVLQVVDTRTDEVVETIPAEELVRQLREIIRPDNPPKFEEAAGGLVVDRSI
jgi:uncharacterized FlaG/YvyC family protein